jgi:hypothetical protein
MQGFFMQLIVFNRVGFTLKPGLFDVLLMCRLERNIGSRIANAKKVMLARVLLIT